MKKQGKVTWQSPSNIAVVKYWGKKEFQVPLNPSVSMTLSESYTETAVEYTQHGQEKGIDFKLLFEGTSNSFFEEKIKVFLEKAIETMPILETVHLTITSRNTFPHSAGIASSASSFSALALCLCSMEEELTGMVLNNAEFNKKASELARLGSGSACRSIYGGWVSWGEIAALEGTSDYHGSPLSYLVDQNFHHYHDAILVIDSTQKNISSNEGHALMDTNPYKECRVEEAMINAEKMVHALAEGDMDTFSQLTEKEAASLHAMFLTSTPGYILTKPNTLSVIERLKKFREETGLPFCFTLDAGPNVHVLYPSSHRDKMKEFIELSLTEFCQDGKWIEDKIGNGPKKIVT